MERVSRLSSTLTKASSQLDDSEETQPSMRKRYPQATEDLKKVMLEWKAKSSIEPSTLAPFVLGEIYPYFKEIVEFNSKEMAFTYGDYHLKSKDEQRALTNVILAKFMKRFPVTLDTFVNKPWLLSTLPSTVGLMYGSAGTKLAVHYGLYCKTIHTLGTDKHLPYLERGIKLADVGCFALTEMSHGSNVQGMLTTATFDPEEKKFIINTPIERAAKFWIGGASQTSNMSIVGANLIVNGKNFGVHMFIVQLRDTKTHELMSGITISDCGGKFGLHGVDNGMIFFRNVSVPLEALLDKVTQVDESGKVESKFPRKSQRFAIQLSGLCDGRVKLLINSSLGGIKSLAIGLRFAAVRRQFGPSQSNEVCLLEYPQYQNRLFPLAAATILSIFAAREANNLWFANYPHVLEPKHRGVKEMHAFLSIMKPLLTWWSIETVTQVRFAMGGFGYLSISYLPSLIQDMHASPTWEGDNWILLQQSARFVLKGVLRLLTGRQQEYSSLEFLTLDEPSEYFPTPFDEASFKDAQVQLKLMSYRATLSAKSAAATFQINLTSIDAFNAWNKSVPFGFSEVAIHFGELRIFQIALEHISTLPESANKVFLKHLLTIFCLTKLKESWTQVCLFLDRSHLEIINKVLLETMDAVKHDLVKAMDGFAINDEFLNSTFGHKDGDVYNRLLSRINGEGANFGKPADWRTTWENRQSY